MPQPISIINTTAAFRREEAKRLFNRIVRWVKDQQTVVGLCLIQDLIHHVITTNNPSGLLPFIPVVSKKEVLFRSRGMDYEIGLAISPHIPFEGRIHKVTNMVAAFGYAIGTVTYSDRKIGGKPVTRKLIWSYIPIQHPLMAFWLEGGPKNIKVKPITGASRRLIRGKEITRYRGLVLTSVWYNVKSIDNAIRSLKPISLSEEDHHESLQHSLQEPAVFTVYQ